MPFLHSLLRRHASHCQHLPQRRAQRFVNSSTSPRFHIAVSNRVSLSSIISDSPAVQQRQIAISKSWPAFFSSSASNPSSGDHPIFVNEQENLSSTTTPPSSSALVGISEEQSQYSKYLSTSSFPLHSLDSKTIVEIVAAIRRLTQVATIANETTAASTSLSTSSESLAQLELVFQLLDRLTLELEAPNTTTTDNVVDSHLLHDVISAWSHAIVKPKTHPAQQPSLNKTLLTPAYLFDKMCQWQARLPDIPPNIKTYTLIINAVTQSQPQDPDLAEAILEYAADSFLYVAKSSTAFPADSRVFDSVIDCWSKSNRADAAHHAEKILKRMIDWSDAGWVEVAPTVVTYNCVINAWAKAPPTTMYKDMIPAPQRAEQLLEEMKQNGLMPDRWSYSTVLSAWARHCKAQGGPDRANAILQHMKNLYDQQLQNQNPNQQLEVDAKPTTRCYSAVMAAYANQGSVLRAEQLLWELIERYKTTRDSDFLPDVTCFTSLIHAWSRSGRKDAPQMAEAVLQRMQDFAASTGETSVRPDVVSFSAVLQAWAQSKHPKAPFRCEEIVKRMQDLHQSGYANTQPDALSYKIALGCWAKASSLVEAPERAEAMLRQMNVLYEKGQNSQVRPNVTHYSIVVRAWSQSRLPHAANRAQALYDEMVQQWKAGNASLKPNEYTLTALIAAWGRRQSQVGAMKAQAIFDDVVTRHALREDHKVTSSGSGDVDMEGNILIRHDMLGGLVADGGQRDEEAMAVQSSGAIEFEPSVVIYTALIDAWAKAGEVDRAEQILREMTSSGVKPNRFTYTVVIGAWSRSKRPDAATHAQALFDELKQRSKSGEPDSKPGMYAYTTLISAWARSKTRKGALMAQAIFDDVLSQYRSGDEDLRPQLPLYSALIDAWAKAGEAEKAENILREMLANQSSVKPDIVIYTSVINAWSRAGNPARAHLLYQEMIQKWEAGDDDMKPSIYTFTVLMSAWGRSKSVEGAIKAQAIFDFVWARYNATNDQSFKPTEQTLCILIDAWSKAGQAEKAEAVLRQMNSGVFGTTADIVAYSTAIDAWSKSGHPDAGPRAQALYDELVKKWESGDYTVKPNSHTFASVILAWGRSRSLDGATRAQAMYEDMIARQNKGDTDLVPTIYVCGALIDAWIKVGMMEKAEVILRSMDVKGKLTSAPTVSLYCSIIATWLRSGHPDALDRMQSLYDDLMHKYRNGNNDLKPDMKLYETVMDGWLRTKTPQGIAKAGIVFKDLEAQANSGGIKLEQRVTEKYKVIIQRNAAALQIEPL